MSNKELVSVIKSPEQLKEELSLSDEALQNIEASKQRISDIITGKSDRKLLIVGPCSVDFEESILEYSKFIKNLRNTYSSKIEFIMRFYTAKPRTVGGWKGISNSDPFEKNSNIGIGMERARALGIKIIESTGLPLADEMLHPQLSEYFEDILSYQAVGARSSENQYHREVASGLEVPVGFKNPMSGDLGVMMNSIKAGNNQSSYTICNNIYETTGNKLSHGILRGSTLNGVHNSNFDKDSLKKVFDLFQDGSLENKGFIIDTNHDNSNKKHELQIDILNKVFDNLEELENEGCTGIKDMFKGFMVESYLFDGNQKIEADNIVKGLSLTDPCIGKEKTEVLVKNMDDNI